MNDRYGNNKQYGFRIYEDLRPSSSASSQNKVRGSQTLDNHGQKQMEIALLQKLHAQTLIVGFLQYKGEIKGIRFFEPAKGKFIDVAPWHLSSFSMSKLKLMGVRNIELYRHEAGEAQGTVLIEYLTKHELAGYYRANRMIPNDLAQALSTITNYMDDTAYQQLMAQVNESN